MKPKFFSLYFLLLLGSFAHAGTEENLSIEFSKYQTRNSIGRTDSCDKISPKVQPQVILKKKLKKEVWRNLEENNFEEKNFGEKKKKQQKEQALSKKK